MFYVRILFIFIVTSPVICTKVGTVLFYKRNPRSGCWTQDDIAKLRSRELFENVMPPRVTPDKVDNKYIKDCLHFFVRTLRMVDKIPDQHTAAILKEALSDSIGGHLRSEILPTVRFAYYAGYVPYRSARQVHDFYDEVKRNLNTQGLGWTLPDKLPQWSNLSVVKILIGSGKLLDPCSFLITKRDANSCIHLPLPKLDDPAEPSSIALPFKSGGLASLTSPNSENVLLKYYTTASRCILRSSPKNCRHSDFVNFNNELWHWMKRNVAPHLVDEKLYSGYGGILRIAAAVQSYGKGLSRRNLFDEDEISTRKWRPWEALTQSYIYINADWTPKIYVGLVILAAIAICALQTCYHYTIGDASGCRCMGRPEKQVAYANVDMNFPAMLPSHESTLYNVEKRSTTKSIPRSKTKASSTGSLKTQKVYDLNENTEKLMEVIVSDNEESDSDSPSGSKPDSEEDNVIIVGKMNRSNDIPPQLETPIAQLRINSTPRKDQRGKMQMYSTSTVTQSDMTSIQEQQCSDTLWSGTGSTTSGQTVSTSSTKSRNRKTRSSRDLAWARRVVSKHSTNSRTKSSIATELDMNSFTTPPSQR